LDQWEVFEDPYHGKRVIDGGENCVLKTGSVERLGRASETVGGNYFQGERAESQVQICWDGGIGQKSGDKMVNLGDGLISLYSSGVNIYALWLERRSRGSVLPYGRKKDQLLHDVAWLVGGHGLRRQTCLWRSKSTSRAV
jgi:hypothetical protein